MLTKVFEKVRLEIETALTYIQIAEVCESLCRFIHRRGSYNINDLVEICFEYINLNSNSKYKDNFNKKDSKLLNWYSSALEWHNKGILILNEMSGLQNKHVMKIYQHIEEFRNEMKDIGGSFEWRKKALGINDDVIETESLEMAYICSDISSDYFNIGELNKCYEWEIKALQIFEKVLVKDDPHLAYQYFLLASFVFYYKYDCDTALEWYVKALYIQEKVYGKEHHVTGETYKKIAQTYEIMDKYDLTIEWYIKYLAVQENEFGKGSIQTADTCRNIAVAYQAIEDFSHSYEWYDKALIVENKPFSVWDSKFIRTPWLVLVKSSYEDDAIPCYKKAFEIEKRVCYKGNLCAIKICNTIAQIYNEFGDSASSAEWYNKGLELLKKAICKKEIDDMNLSYKDFMKTYLRDPIPKKDTNFNPDIVVQ